MRLIISFVFILFLFFSFPEKGHAAPTVSAEHAVLIEQSTGRVLFEKDGYTEDSIASITKIMTAILAIESGKMEEKAKASRNAIYTEGSSIYLEQGEMMTIEDLVYGLMLRSGNDAAVAIAEHIGGSEDGFVFLMNEKTKWLGMEHTHFDNSHGLDSESHYSSAYDMAKLTRYAMQNDQFKEIFATKTYRAATRSYGWQNKNKLLTQYYEYTTGGKTGFTKQTGRTLVSTASKDGMDLIAVTLNAPDDWRDHIQMFEWGFENFNMEKIADQGAVSYQVVQSNENRTGYMNEDLFYPLSSEETAELEQQNFLLPEDEESSIIGKTFFFLNGEKIKEKPIYKENEHRGFSALFLSTLKKHVGM